MDPQLAESLRPWLADASRLQASLLSSGYQGSAYLYSGEVRGQSRRYVIKQAAQGRLTGWLHRWLLRREARAYALLAEVQGVPHAPGLLDDKWLVLDYIEGRPLHEVRDSLHNPAGFYQRLHTIIRDCHAAGVAHGDLKRKDNVLVTADEQPWVIDFGTAIMRGGGWLERRLFPLVCRMDHNAWIKAKYRKDLAAISVSDARWHRPTFIENSFRLLRRFWRTVSLRQTRKRWRRQRRHKRRGPG